MSDAVVCTGYVERRPPQNDLVKVEIMVTREAHKGILIGRGGTSMKALTSAARVEVCTRGCSAQRRGFVRIGLMGHVRASFDTQHSRG